MVQLVFDATLVPPSPGVVYDEEPIRVYNPTPATQQEYITACRQRKAHIERLRDDWKDAVERCNALKLAIPQLKAAWQHAREMPAPRSPYADIIFGGGSIDPDLANEG